MRQIYICRSLCFVFSLLLFFSEQSKAQGFNFQLTGNPVNTTGWTMAPQSSVNGDEIVLTQNINSQIGYIYYSTPQSLANCSQFTVKFDFRITNPSNPTADGLTFFYMTNPPNNFVVGGGIGLPNSVDGLVLILDTYNNSGPNNVPLVSLRRFNNDTYVESSNTGLLAPDVGNQNFITDGNWHTCELNYNFGTVSVSFDNNPPIMTGNTTLNISGYFGFTSATGGYNARHAIKNVSIYGAPEPDAPTADTLFYCVNDSVRPLEVHPDSNLLWYDAPVGGNQLSQAPIPSTQTPGTYTWWVSQVIPGCQLESSRSPVVVVVRSLPTPPSIHIPTYCSGQPGAAIRNPIGSQILWYEHAVGGTPFTNPPSPRTDTAANYYYFVSQVNEFGCESKRDSVKVTIYQSPEIAFTSEVQYGCGDDIVLFNNQSQYSQSYLWHFGDRNLTDTNRNTQHRYPASGSYLVTLRAANEHCVDSASQVVTLEPHPLIADFSVSKDTICAGGSVAFQNHSTVTTINGQDGQYLWDFGDGQQSGLTHPEHRFLEPGVYPVRLVVSNAIPCSDTMIKWVYVDSMPAFIFTVRDSVLCVGDQVLISERHREHGFEAIRWNFGDGQQTTIDGGQVTHAYDRSGLFVISGTASYKTCPDTTYHLSVRVKDLPYLNLGRDTTLCLDGDPLIIGDHVNTGNPQASWRWSSGDTTAIKKITNPGNYWAEVTIDFCTMRDHIIITKDCYLDIPNSFTPNGDGHNDYFLPRQLLSKGLAAFNMKIWNRWGQVVFETNSVNGRGWDGRFNGKDQGIGVYIYIIEATYKNGRKEQYKGNVTLLR